MPLDGTSLALKQIVVHGIAWSQLPRPSPNGPDKCNEFDVYQN